LCLSFWILIYNEPSFFLYFFFRNIFHLIFFIVPVFIPVTRSVKGCTGFVGKYLTGRTKRFRPRSIYILDHDHWTSRSSHVRLSVCPYERWDLDCPYERCDLGYYKSSNTGIRHADFSIPAQRKFVSVILSNLLTQRKFVSVAFSCAAQVCFVNLRSASLFRQRATPTLTPTHRPKLRLLQF